MEFCQSAALRWLLPAELPLALAAQNLKIFVGGPGTGQTSEVAVSVVEVALQEGKRIICVTPTVRARQTIVRVMCEKFPDKVRVLGGSRLDATEAAHTSDSLIQLGLCEALQGMLSVTSGLKITVRQLLDDTKWSSTHGFVVPMELVEVQLLRS